MARVERAYAIAVYPPAVTLAERLFAHPTLYGLTQYGFAEQKLEPLLRRNEVAGARRVLDVGCGPGTNTGHFPHAHYVGLDVNPRYLEVARRRFGREFIGVDVANGLPGLGEPFDFVLVNSFFHHVDDAATGRILRTLRGVVAPDGHIHVLDILLPERLGPALALARLDRGRFVRPLDACRRLFAVDFEPVHVETFGIGRLGMTLWEMVYFKGRPRP